MRPILVFGSVRCVAKRLGALFTFIWPKNKVIIRSCINSLPLARVSPFMRLQILSARIALVTMLKWSLNWGNHAKTYPTLIRLLTCVLACVQNQHVVGRKRLSLALTAPPAASIV
jgi:uncharacterized membrane protein